MITARVQRVLNVLDQHNTYGEVLLFKSFVYGQAEFQRTGDDLTDLVLGCFANNIPEDISYNGQLDNISPEYDWAHHKIMGIPYHVFGELSDRGYSLTHQVFWGTDFGRSPVEDNNISQRILQAIDLESDDRIGLLAEYLISLIATNHEVDQITLSLITNWFDNVWDGSYCSHRVIVCGILFAKLGI